MSTNQEIMNLQKCQRSHATSRTNLTKAIYYTKFAAEADNVYVDSGMTKLDPEKRL
jgi:hypothetical protein